ncbi:MAG TPA: hypothetical protein VI589_14360 [Vicinamibacteria bacterium]
MRRFDAIPVLLTAALLAGCQASGNSTPAKEDKRSGGVLSLLKRDPITIPEGATFPLVLETAISSATSRSGDVVVARLAEDIRVGEKVVVPSGSEIRGRVTEATPSGRVKTRARLAFDFDTLVLESKEHSIGTRPVDITAGSTHKKDAATVGIGAGAGAIVGAIIDGKKGAGIGALIGGATGTGVVLTNTGKEISLATGSRVTVRLVQEVRL